jgi:hypothetical protein
LDEVNEMVASEATMSEVMMKEVQSDGRICIAAI